MKTEGTVGAIDLHNTTAKVFVLGDDVNTDLHCSSKYLPGKSLDYIASVAFEQLSPGMAGQISAFGGGILVAGENFGINSSREQATHILQLMNIKGIIAKSFGRQFYRNAINNGLPILECDVSQIKNGEEITVDFSRGEIRTVSGVHLQAKALPKEILALIEAGGLIAFLKNNPDWNFAK